MHQPHPGPPTSTRIPLGLLRFPLRIGHRGTGHPTVLPSPPIPGIPLPVPSDPTIAAQNTVRKKVVVVQCRNTRHRIGLRGTVRRCIPRVVAPLLVCLPRHHRPRFVLNKSR